MKIARVAVALGTATLAGAALAQQMPYEGELRERLSKPVIASLESRKPAYDLELCVADVMTVMGVPTVLRDGPDNLQMMINFPNGNSYTASVSFIKLANGTRLDIRLRGKGWDDRLRDRLTTCL
jgi:hypothetical protein